MQAILIKAVNSTTGGRRFGYLLHCLRTGKQFTILAGALAGSAKHKGRVFIQVGSTWFLAPASAA